MVSGQSHIHALIHSVAASRGTRRRFVAGMAATGLSLGLAGRAAEAQSDLSGTIVYYKGPFAQNDAELMEQIIANFNQQYPNVEVVWEQFDWQQMDSQIPARMMSGSPPDVTYFVDNQYGEWIGRNILEDLTPLVTDPEYKSEYDAVRPDFWETARSRKDGLIYGVPYGGVLTSFLFLNLDLLEQAGVTDVNSSVDAFHAAATAVRGLGDDIYGFSIRGAPYNPSAFDWTAWIHAAGTDLLNEDWSACAVNTPEAQQLFQRLSDMQTTEGLAPAPGAYDWTGLRDLWRGGKTGIMHDENTFISILREDPPDFNFDVAAIPQGPSGDTPTGMWNFGLLSIAKESQNKEAAWAFVQHLASAEEEARYFEQVSFSPCRTDLADVMYQDDPYMAKVQTDILPRSKGWQLHPQLNAMLGESQAHFDALYLGQQTAEETLGNVCAVIEGSL